MEYMRIPHGVQPWIGNLSLLGGFFQDFRPIRLRLSILFYPDDETDIEEAPQIIQQGTETEQLGLLETEAEPPDNQHIGNAGCVPDLNNVDDDAFEEMVQSFTSQACRNQNFRDSLQSFYRMNSSHFGIWDDDAHGFMNESYSGRASAAIQEDPPPIGEKEDEEAAIHSGPEVDVLASRNNYENQPHVENLLRQGTIARSFTENMIKQPTDTDVENELDNDQDEE